LGLTDSNGNTTVIRLAQYRNRQLHKVATANPIISISFDPRIFLLSRSTITRDNTLAIDFDAPKIISQKPAHLAENVPTKTDLELSFNENIFKNVGKITIRQGIDNNIFQELDVNANAVKLSGSRITIQAKEFERDKTYFVEISPDAVVDRYDNFFGGFSGGDTWRFSTEKNSSSLPKVFPNPTHDWLYFENGDIFEKVVIHNALGQLLGTYAHVSAISLAHLPKGIYFIQMQHKANSYNYKIVRE